jgi:predicted phage terminase large subunit-like protein
MEFTEPLTADLLARTNTREATIESNNGGRGFSRKVNDLTPKTCIVGWEHQSKNKEARIISNAATVTETIIFPEDWASRWPEFYSHITNYKRIFKSNAYDDGPDTLTGIAEKVNMPYKAPVSYCF